MTEPSITTASVLQALESRFATRSASSTRTSAAAEDTRLPYLRAAAVLHVFNLAKLRPFGDETRSQDPYALLFDDTVPAVGWRHAKLRTLKLEVRQATLRALGSRQTMATALEANPDRERTSVQILYERWLAHESFDVDRMACVDLEDLSQLYEWGLAAFGGLPPREQFQQALVRRSSVAIFEHLVDRNFVGRTRELQDLRDHVGVVSPSVWARVRRFLGSEPRAPLVIWGPGGSGKTALVGRFLMEHVEAPDSGWFPFAYLPFDSETLDVREPFTLLVAASTQLAAQVGSLDGPRSGLSVLDASLKDFREHVEAYRDRRGTLQRRASQYAKRGERIGSLTNAEEALFVAFSELLQSLTAAAASRQRAENVPVVLVLDTFEEVVYRTREDLLGLWRMLDYVQRKFPPLRVVIAGRGKPNVPELSGFAPTYRELGDLDTADAVALLKRLGVSDDSAARALVRQVGGNPLTLRLAARVVREERPGSGGIVGLQTKKFHVFNIGPELVRGQLYRRILDHIHDDDVRALAHPGMVLRRVTSGVIKAVLAPACNLTGITKKRSRDLFLSLKAEHTLVSIEDDGSLRYREEVRRPMLELLMQDKPAQVKRIHELAVEHYQPLDEPVDHAEEIYHRMMLGQEGYALDDRWIPGVERYLASAIDELPLPQRRWLAGRMSIELPPEVYRLADLAEWERLIGRKALEAARYSSPQDVLSLLRDRAERTPQSPLFAIEARALLDLKRPVEAAAVLDRALASFPALANPGRLSEILWLRAQAASAQDETAQCLAFLEQLADVTSAMPSRLAHVQALTEILGQLVPDSARDNEDPRAGAVREMLSGALMQLTEAEVDAERSLIRLALVRLGRNYPIVIARLVRLVIYDLSYLAQQGPIDVAPVLEEVTTDLESVWPVRGSFDVILSRIVEGFSRRSGPDDRGVHSAIQPLADAVLKLMGTEGATLASASLAGIDDYREPWELHVAAEVAA